jgi:hypothetical protein
MKDNFGKVIYVCFTVQFVYSNTQKKFDMSTLNNFPKIHFGILNFIFQKTFLHYKFIYILNMNKINNHFSSILMHINHLLH